eukprot:407178_1
MTGKFVDKWISLPINTLVKMKNIAYLVLMKTLKLTKTDFSSKDDDAPWYVRDCKISIQFIEKRSLADFAKLWNAMINSNNFGYMFDILSLLISEYARRKSIEIWHNVSRAGYEYKNHYRNVTYVSDIRCITEQLIIHVFQTVIRTNKYLDVSVDLKSIITTYIATVEMDKDYKYVTSLYEALIRGYFKQCDSMNPAIAMLFECCFEDKRTLLKSTCLQIFGDDSKGGKFFDSVCELSLIESDRFNYLEIYEFFIKMHKDESLKHIQWYLIKNSDMNETFMKFVTMFFKILKHETDDERLSKLSTLLIEKHLLECVATESSVKFIIQLYGCVPICDRFQKLDEIEKIKFLKHLFGLFKKKNAEIIQFGVLILKPNVKEAIKTFEYWFSVLMIEQ